MNRTLFNSLIIITILFLGACSEVSVPKPRGYVRINLPEHSYQVYAKPAPYQFEYPTYAEVVSDSSANTEPFWINVSFPTLNSKVHLTYKPIKSNLAQLTEDAYTFAYKHTIKAEGIEEQVFSNPDKKVYGILYNIKGNAASNIQFYVTDSVRHFMRGSLYFQSIPNKDSLAPVIQFIRQDIVHLIETLEWR